MTFRPFSNQHSLVEVVFIVGLSGVITRDTTKALVTGSEILRSDLPSVRVEPEATPPGSSQTTGTGRVALQFILGDGNIALAPPGLPASVDFSSFSRSGGLEWRARVAGNQLIVNCCVYSRWASVWPQARGYLAHLGGLLSQGGFGITNLGLQFIDCFVWDGDVSAYDVCDLIDEGSQRVPTHVRTLGPLWHVHQGWFQTPTDVGCPVEFSVTRVLERLNIDAATGSHLFDEALGLSGSYVVKVDSLVRFDLATANLPEDIFQPDALGDWVFGKMHEMNKATLRSVLTASVKEKINLDA